MKRYVFANTHGVAGSITKEDSSDNWIVTVLHEQPKLANSYKEAKTIAKNWKTH